MNCFKIGVNEFLSKTINAFYHTHYVGYKQPGNPDYINCLKNQFNDVSDYELSNAQRELKTILQNDLSQIYQMIPENDVTVCVVPRAKIESTYSYRQLLFKRTVRETAYQCNFADGADYIIRIEETRTTHIKSQNIINKGPRPYKGITKDTCRLSDQIAGKTILLIDDIYTKTVNIDEDCIQALLDKGAKKIYFYAIGNTLYKGFSNIIL